MHVWMKRDSRLSIAESHCKDRVYFVAVDFVQNVMVYAFFKVPMIMQMLGSQLSILLNKTSQFWCNTGSAYVISSFLFWLKNVIIKLDNHTWYRSEVCDLWFIKNFLWNIRRQWVCAYYNTTQAIRYSKFMISPLHNKILICTENAFGLTVSSSTSLKYSTSTFYYPN